MKTMKAAVLRGHDQPHCIGDVTLGKPEPGEALVRTVGVGMCHTDMLPRDPELASALGPVILGHEGAGVVEQVGGGVTRVSSAWSTAAASAGLVRWRTGSEGRISYLKRGYGWDRTRLDGTEGARTWAGYGVLARNLVKISTLAS
jgi:aryl-alcohol dehydrogenase